MAIKQIVILFCVIGVSLAANEECASVGTGFVKHPDDTKCSEYISCVKGVAYERTCPYGLYHDKCKQDVCDYPDNLDEKCKCTGAPAPTTCPKEGTKLIANPEPNQCHKYIICVNGKPIDAACAAGLSFNPTTEKCEPASSVDCKIDTCGMTWDAVAKKGHVVAFAPDASDCANYFLCAEGKVQFTWNCGEGSAFDLSKTTTINSVEFPGTCVKKSSETTVVCYNGQNWTPPPFPA